MRSIFVRLILLFLFLVVVEGQTCYQQAVSMRFKPQSQGPPFSFIHTAGMAGTVRRSVALPRTIIQVLDSDGQVDRNANSIEITVTSNANLNKDGVTVKVFRGEAHFTRIILEGLASVMNLTFTANAQDTLFSAGVQGATISSGNFTVLDRDPGLWNLSFIPYANAVLYAGQPLTIASGLPVPPIRVSIINAQYDIYPTQSQMAGTNITAVAQFDGNPSATISGGSALAYDGVFLFDSMVITTALTELPPLRFRIIEGSSSSFVTVATGPISVRTVADYSHIAFLDESESFIYGQGVSIFAVNGIPLPPIRIGVFDTIYRTSPAITGLVITATCNRAKISGSVVGVMDGVATFDSLTFTDITDVRDGADKSFAITFTAGNQDDLPLKGDSIITGHIMVNTGIRSPTSVRFLQSPLDSLFNAQNQKQQVVFYLSLNPVRIELLNNANQRDTGTQMTFTATAPNSLTPSSYIGTLSGGVATFSSLQFSTAKSSWYPRLTFVASDNTSSRLTLTTGYITVTSSQANFNLRFQPYGMSLIVQEGTSAVATIGVPLPPIIIELINSAGSLDVSSSTVGITATCEGAELTNSYMRVTNGVATFSSLTFVSETAGDFILTFTASGEGLAVDRKSIVSGTITVAAVETPAFGLRFNREQSYIGYEGAVMPITNGELIPPVVVELLTSSGAVDTQTSTVRITCTTSSGAWATQSTTERPIAKGQATFNDLRLSNAFSPVIECCAKSTNPNDLHAVEDKCARSGTMAFSQVVGSEGRLVMLNSTQIDRLVALGIRTNVTIDSGATFPAAIGLGDTSGWWSSKEARLDVSVSCSITLRPPLTVQMTQVDNKWYAYFGTLQFANDVPSGVSPIITFSAVGLQPITSGLITVAGTNDLAGTDIAIEVYYSYRSFDFSAWNKVLCARLNIETDRVIARRIDEGGGMNKITPSEETINIVKKTWVGTRLDLRVLEPLPTSRVTKRSSEVAALILAMKVDCDSTDLRIRRAFLPAAEVGCDFGLFDEQQNGAKQCIESNGKDGYCDCYVPMFEVVGKNCLGYNPLTTLCTETLIPNAKCSQKAITEVCDALVFGEVPRASVAGSGLFLLIFVPPVAYLYLTGYFARLSRPNTKHVHIPHAENIFGDDGL